jgi:hypothetical protein
MSQLVALSWLNLPCALKAAIGIGKRTLAALASPLSAGGPRQGPAPVREPIFASEDLPHDCHRFARSGSPLRQHVGGRSSTRNQGGTARLADMDGWPFLEWRSAIPEPQPLGLVVRPFTARRLLSASSMKLSAALASGSKRSRRSPASPAFRAFRRVQAWDRVGVANFVLWEGMFSERKTVP